MKLKRLISNSKTMQYMKPQKTAAVLLIIALTVAILYYGSGFLIPLAFGILLAMIFHPLASWAEKRGMPRWASIGLSLFLFILALGILSGVMVMQTRSLVKDWPKIQEQLAEQQHKAEQFVIKNIGIASEERIQKAKDKLAQQQSAIANMVGGFLGSLFSFFTGLIFALVYMVFIMMVQRRLVKAALDLVPKSRRQEAREVMHSARQTASEYLAGRLLLIGILALIYAIGFLVFGLQYAIPVALLTAVLSIIPYIGNIIGGLFALMLGVATGGSTTLLLGIIGTMTLAQVLENNVLTPWIMSREVNLNPLATFATVIGFSLIWGVAGSILAIPITGVVKKVFEHVDGLKPVAFALGTGDGE
jgi:predicted PurR-regulated permease PerM